MPTGRLDYSDMGLCTLSVKHHSETNIITNTVMKQSKGLNGERKPGHKNNLFVLSINNKPNFVFLSRRTCTCRVMSLLLTLSTLGGNFTRRHIKIFLFSPRKQVLKFHANCLQCIRSNRIVWELKKKYHQFVVCRISRESGKS